MPNTPADSQRSTRSGSTSSPSLNDIKSLLESNNTKLANTFRQDMKTLVESSKSEILDAVKKENDRLQSMIQDLKTRFDDLETHNRCLVARCDFLETKCSQLEKRISQSEMSDETLINETLERYRRRKWLMVSGLPEPTTGSIRERKNADIQELTDLASTIGVDDLDLEPEEVMRVGRSNASGPRLLRFKCESTNVKFDILKKAKDLRNHPELNGVYINPDLTKSQRATNKSLREELKRRRAEGERVYIHRGKIVVKSTETDENFQ